MRIAVQDANVLIDLELAGLFEAWFSLGIETHTTDLIKGELAKGNHHQAIAYFGSGQIREYQLSWEELAKVEELEREVNSKAKFADCSVLFLAMKLEGAMLISGDKPLRRAGFDRHIDVHGTLWILDRIVESKALSGAVASAKLRSLLEMKRFFPADECRKRFAKWEGEAG